MLDKEKQTSYLSIIPSLLLSILLIIRGIVELLILFGLVPPPSWLTEVNDQTTLVFLIYQFVNMGPLALALSIFSIIATVGWIREWNPWILLLGSTLIIILSIIDIILWIIIPNSIDLLYWPNWIKLAVASIGFLVFYSVLTIRKRYE